MKSFVSMKIIQLKKDWNMGLKMIPHIIENSNGIEKYPTGTTGQYIYTCITNRLLSLVIRRVIVADGSAVSVVLGRCDAEEQRGQPTLPYDRLTWPPLARWTPETNQCRCRSITSLCLSWALLHFTRVSLTLVALLNIEPSRFFFGLVNLGAT